MIIRKKLKKQNKKLINIKHKEIIKKIKKNNNKEKKF